MTLRLLRAHLAAHAGSLLLVAAMVLAMAALAALVPRATTHVLSDNLRHEIGDLTMVRRDLSAQESGSPTPGAAKDPARNTLPPASDPVWGTLDDSLRETRRTMAPELRAAYGPGDFAMTLPTAPASPVDPSTRSKADAILSIGIDPRLPDRVTITEGRAPRPVADRQPLEIVLSDTVATSMDWPVGQERTSLSSTAPPRDVRLSGTYTAKDAKDPIWAQIPATLTPSVFLPDGSKPIVTGVGWAAPDSYPELLPVSDGLQVRAWFPLDPTALTAGSADIVATQLREFTRQAQPVPGEPFLEDFRGDPSLFGLTKLAFASDSAVAIRDAGVGGSAALAMIALFASGPLGVAAAVLVLAAGLVLRQQSRSLALVTARGLSARQLRMLLAVEGLTIGVPSAAVGAAIGAIVLPADGSPAAWWWPAVIGLAPAALLAAMPPATQQRERADLSSRDGRRWRWTVDLLVLLCAVAAVVVLRTRGLDTPAGAAVDPLLASAPLVLSLAACLGVFRIYPWALGQILARVARWRGSTALIGTARALRDPAAGLTAVLALVTGVGVAVFSGVAVTTLQHGLTETAHAKVGADVVIDGSPLPEELAASLAARDDVRDLVAVTEKPGIRLVTDARPISGTAIIVDVAALRRVQHDVPGALSLPRSLERTSGDRLPVLLSEDFTGNRSGLELEGRPLEVVGSAPSSSALTSRSSWFLIDRQVADRVLPPGLANRLLVDTTDAGLAVRDTARDTADVLYAGTPADARAELEESPLVPAVGRAAWLALGALAVLCASVVALTLVRGEASRSRQSALLGAMGERRRRLRWLVAWEIGPLAVVSVVSGIALGLVLPAVVLDSIDLRAFTTGTDQPSVTINPVLTALVAGGVLLVVVIGAALAALVSRRQDLSRTLRMMED